MKERSKEGRKEGGRKERSKDGEIKERWRK